MSIIFADWLSQGVGGVRRARDVRCKSGWSRIADACIELTRILAVAKCRTDGYPAVRISARLPAPVGLFFESAGVPSRSLNVAG
jgi:hypothetical protein